MGKPSKGGKNVFSVTDKGTTLLRQSCWGVIFVLTVFFVHMLPGQLKAGDSAPITYGYPTQSIFVATLNKLNQPVSPMLSLARVLMERAGLSMESEAYPARRLFEKLRNGTVDFSILVKASSLREHCLFSQRPVYSTTLRVYYLGDKLPIRSQEDFIGKEVITIRGYSYANLLQFISEPANGITNMVAPTHRSAFKMLSRGRAAYLLDYESAARETLFEYKISTLNSNAIKDLDIYLVLSKKYSEAAELMVKLEKIAGSIDAEKIIHRESAQNHLP